MKKIVFLISILTINYFSCAQSQIEVGARQNGIGGSGLVLTDIWSSSHNQAGLADLNGLSVGLFYSNFFNIDAFRQSAFAIALPTEKFGSAGINYTYSGDSFSNFSKFGFAYAKRLGKRITAGIQMDYFRLAQLTYGVSGVAVGEIGLIAEPVDNLFIAAHVFNPWRSKYSGSGETMTSILKIGAGYKFSDKVLFTLEGEKDIEQATVIKAGTEYNVTEGLFLRTGVSTNPTKYSFGLGYEYKTIALDLAYVNYNTLGYFMQFGIAYSINRVVNEKTDE